MSEDNYASHFRFFVLRGKCILLYLTAENFKTKISHIVLELKHFRILYEYNYLDCANGTPGPEVIKTMLNSAEHEIYHAHKCKNANS